MYFAPKFLKAMKTNEATKRQMKKWEGLRLFAYLDTGGVPTIGFGHTKDVRMGDAITLKQAELYFEQDIAFFEKEINSLGVELEQCQFDALVSFCYNIGISKFRRSTLCRYVKMGMNANYIAAEFLKWVHCNGGVLEGLKKRREWEAQKYLGRSPLPA